ncbi:serine hydrolase family protein [Goodfellowiella coeruleoviolacea]|uniref:Beta-lactamase n=1 Tax=Goodfellowiella coeruleoviolacea TaxID=334858 RepID=A0AAE3GJQ9_9PSEU|nr:serine hydrolase [Goodfellowiella coeruleoviolacea]MCP2167428.1 Beta-lactamase [Goodfellowiella coeruleoviolacea]
MAPAIQTSGAEAEKSPELAKIAFSHKYMPDLSVFPNFRRTRALGQGWAGGVASARGVAGAYAAALGVLDDGPAPLHADTVETFTRIRSEGIDLVSGVESRFALGFEVFDARYPCLGPEAFGHGGTAGASAFASPRLTRRHWRRTAGAAAHHRSTSQSWMAPEVTSRCSSIML